MLKRLNFPNHNLTRSNLSNNSSRYNNNFDSNQTIPIKDINNSLVVIPCNKKSHMSVFNEIIYNEFESKKMNKNERDNINGNYFDINQTLFVTDKKRYTTSKNISNLSTNLNFKSYEKYMKYNKNNRLIDKQIQINIPVTGLPNVVKRFYGVEM